MGINWDEDAQKLVGDVNTERVAPLVSAYTPVPGGCRRRNYSNSCSSCCCCSSENACIRVKGKVAPWQQRITIKSLTKSVKPQSLSFACYWRRSEREGLLDTPDRVARACVELFGGMQEDPAAHLRKQFHEEGNKEMVIVRDIPFSSTCEHHILPFVGKAYLLYPAEWPHYRPFKIARCVSGYSRRLQVQGALQARLLTLW